MIKAHSTSPHIFAYGSGVNYVSTDVNNPQQGMVCVNGTTLEVFDYAWKPLNDSLAVGLNRPAQEAIDWAIKKMEEERAWAELAKNNSAVKIALDNIEEARRQLSITAELAREYDTETTS
jgi:hypothetical protein